LCFYAHVREALPKNEGNTLLVPSKVLVPVDGSPASLRALDFAIEMTGQNPGTSLVLLNV
jgi:hypothetical protein